MNVKDYVELMLAVLMGIGGVFFLITGVFALRMFWRWDREDVASKKKKELA